jgi:hypothetical protein
MAHATVNLGGIGLPGFYNPFHKGKRGFHRVCVCVCVKSENFNQLGNLIPILPVRRGHAYKGLASRFCGVLRIKRVNLQAFVGRAAKDRPSRFVGVHNKRRGRS